MGKRTFNATLLDGTYELHFDNRAAYEFQKIHGKQPISVLVTGEMGPMEVSHFVYAGLLHDDDLRKPLDAVIPLIPMKREPLEKLVKVIKAAVLDAYDLEGEEKKQAKKKEKEATE